MSIDTFLTIKQKKCSKQIGYHRKCLQRNILQEFRKLQLKFAFQNVMCTLEM